MPISKFRLSEQRNDDDLYHCWNDIIKNYVYENPLCRVATDFDARLSKIVNKRFVQQNMQILKD